MQKSTDRLERQGRTGKTGCLNIPWKQGICLLLAGMIAIAHPAAVMATSTSQMEKEKRDAQKKLDAT